jgi:hypothetical protein
MAPSILLRSDAVSLSIVPLGGHPDDVGAIVCRVEFEATGVGEIRSSASINVHKLSEFANDLIKIRTVLHGKAAIHSVEEDFECLVDCVAGRVEISGSVRLPRDLGRLQLCFDTDQSFL